MPLPAPERPEIEHRTLEDVESDDYLESYELPGWILRYDVPRRACAQRVIRFLYEEQYQRRFNFLMYKTETEAQTRLVGLFEETDIDWHDCT